MAFPNEMLCERGAVLGLKGCRIPPGVAYGRRITLDMNLLEDGCGAGAFVARISSERRQPFRYIPLNWQGFPDHDSS